MAIAALKPFNQPVRPGLPAPRLVDETDFGGPSQVPNQVPNQVRDQQRALAATFTAPHAHPRFRAVTFSLLTLASVGMWAAIIAAIVHVGQMVHP